MEEKRIVKAETNPITGSTSEAQAGQSLRPLCQILGKALNMLKNFKLQYNILPKTSQEVQVPVYENQEKPLLFLACKARLTHFWL